MSPNAYQPFLPARRPGRRPGEKPRFRVLIHRQYVELWEQLTEHVGLGSAQQFFDHIARTPGEPPAIGRTTILAGKAGLPKAEGFSRTVHYEISGAGRINYQYNRDFTGGERGDSHPVGYILTIDLSSH